MPVDLRRELEDDLALCQKATRGPWFRLPVFMSGTTIQAENGRIVGTMNSECLGNIQDILNADAVAAARTRFPAVVRECVRLLEENERLKGQLKECHDALEIVARTFAGQESGRVCSALLAAQGQEGT